MPRTPEEPKHNDQVPSRTHQSTEVTEERGAFWKRVDRVFGLAIAAAIIGGVVYSKAQNEPEAPIQDEPTQVRPTFKPEPQPEPQPQYVPTNVSRTSPKSQILEAMTKKPPQGPGL